MDGYEFSIMREALGIPIGWLATQLGIDRRTISRWEHGQSAVPGYAERYITMWRDIYVDTICQISSLPERDLGSPDAPREIITGQPVPESMYRAWLGHIAIERAKKSQNRE